MKVTINVLKQVRDNSGNAIGDIVIPPLKARLYQASLDRDCQRNKLIAKGVIPIKKAA